MKPSGRLGITLFVALYLPMILVLSSRAGGPIAEVVAQAYLICALIVGLTYYVTQNKLARAPGADGHVSNPSLGRAFLLIGLSFVLLVGLGAFVAVPVPVDASPSMAMQGVALTAIVMVTMATQAVAAFLSDGPVGFFGRLTKPSENGDLVP